MESDESTNFYGNKLKKCMCSTCSDFLGRKVYGESNIEGTLRFLGLTYFADGIWCGIELDDQVGKSNGTINNFQYFTCKENYGLFLPASEVYVTHNSENFKSILELMTSANSKLCSMGSELQKINSESLSTHNLNESYTVINPKMKLSIIAEENSLHDFSSMSDIIHVSKLSDSVSNCTENLHFKDQVVKCSFSAISEEVNKLLKLKFNDASQSSSSDSNDSLGIIPELANINGSETFDIYSPNKYLNATFKITGSSVNELYENDAVIPEPDEVFIGSSLHNTSHLYQINNESPILNNKSMTIYASTPKHEKDFDGFLESVTEPLKSNPQFNENTVKEKDTDKILTYEINKSLNKTDILEEKVLPNLRCCDHYLISPVKNENVILEQNILSETFRICDNNFEDALVEACDIFKEIGLKEMCSEMKDNLNVTCNLDQQFDIKKASKDQPEKLLNVTCNIDQQFHSETVCRVQDERLLNVACNIESLDKNPACLKSVDEIGDLNVTLEYPLKSQKNCNTFNAINGNVTKKVISHTISSKKQCLQNKTLELLNKTYEKIDLSPKVNFNRESMHHRQSKIFKNIKSDKENIPGPKTKILQKENSNTVFSAFDKKSNSRKSYGCFGNANMVKNDVKKQRTSLGASSDCTKFNSASCNTFPKIEILPPPNMDSKNPSAKNFRKSVGSFNSIDKIGKGNNSKELRRNSIGGPVKSVRNMQLGPSSSKNSLKMVNLHESSNEKSLNVKPLNSMLISESRVQVKNENATNSNEKKVSCLLNETVNLVSTPPDFGKTVVKKPRASINRLEFKVPFEIPKISSQEKLLGKNIQINKGLTRPAQLNKQNVNSSNVKSAISPATSRMNNASKKSISEIDKQQIRSASKTDTACEIQIPTSKTASKLPPYNGQKRIGFGISNNAVSERCNVDRNINLNDKKLLQHGVKIIPNAKASDIPPLVGQIRIRHGISNSNTTGNCKVDKKVNINDSAESGAKAVPTEKGLTTDEVRKEPMSRIPSIRLKKNATQIPQLQDHAKQAPNKEQPNQRVTRSSTFRKIKSPSITPSK